MNKVSIVVPCYNEEESLDLFYEEISKVALEMNEVEFEIIFVDDGRIKAVGTHNELIANCEDYRVMVELQKLEEERGE